MIWLMGAGLARVLDMGDGAVQFFGLFLCEQLRGVDVEARNIDIVDGGGPSVIWLMETAILICW